MSAREKHEFKSTSFFSGLHNVLLTWMLANLEVFLSPLGGLGRGRPVLNRRGLIDGRHAQHTSEEDLEGIGHVAAGLVRTHVTLLVDPGRLGHLVVLGELPQLCLRGRPRQGLDRGERGENDGAVVLGHAGRGRGEAEVVVGHGGGGGDGGGSFEDK